MREVVQRVLCEEIVVVGPGRFFTAKIMVQIAAKFMGASVVGGRHRRGGLRRLHHVAAAKTSCHRVGALVRLSNNVPARLVGVRTWR